MIFSVKRVSKDQSDDSGNLGKLAYQISVNFHIHLGKNEREINQGLNVHAGNLPECCVRCITGKRWETQLPMDKEFAT